MKKRSLHLICQLLLTGLVFWTNSTFAQTAYSANGVKVAVEGTSNIHDWVMNSTTGQCTGTLTVGPDGHVQSIAQIKFTVSATSLKSEHAQMDKNTYKALNTDKYPTIQYVSNSNSIKPGNGKQFTVISKGKLTISGTTKDVELTAQGVVNADKTISLQGGYNFNMTQFGVKPPSIMMGTIKVGDGLKIKYNLALKAI